MLLSLRWLKSLFPNDLSVGDLSDALTHAGLEVEDIRDYGLVSGKLVVGKVLELTPHPGADRLTLVKVDVGKSEPIAIVCGATNLTEGMHVPCALPGAVLPGDFKIKKSRIRGEASAGMLCSAKELEFGSDHSGIMELPKEFEVGEPFDCVLDIKVTPNRPDCLSVFGIGREVAAMIGKKIYPATPRFSETLNKTAEFIDLLVTARDACPRYTCRYIHDIEIGESPLWMRRALEASGLRSINNIVDVTNYVMLELGIPLHAFDYDRIRGGKINVRFAEDGEKFVTLDDRELELTSADLVIADEERPIALAGVMGGKNTEVTESTRHIVLECACFDPDSIRRTARRYGISTDSSYLFERGTDCIKVSRSLNRATQLLKEVANGGIAKGILDVDQKPDEEPLITLDVRRVNDLLGLSLLNSDVADCLVRVGFEIRESENDELIVASPSYRVDVKLDVDLIEEVARIHGYDNIPETMPAVVSSRGIKKGSSSPARLLRRVREILAGIGLSEAVHTSTISEDAARRHGFDPETLPRLANPLTVDQTIMRPTLIPQMIATVAFNQRQGAERVAMFESAKVFPAGSRVGEEDDEGLSLVIILAGGTPPAWTGGARDYDFFDMKGILEAFAHRIGLGELKTAQLPDGETFHPGRSSAIIWGGAEVGRFGELHPAQLAFYEIRGRAQMAEIDLHKLFALITGLNLRFKSIARFPPSRKDIAVVVDEDVAAGSLLEVARKAGAPMIEDLSVIDLYRGEGVEPGKKSIAMRMRLRAADRTLTEDEITQTMSRIVAALGEHCGAQLRS